MASWPYIGANDFDQGDITFERCKFLSAERASNSARALPKTATCCLPTMRRLVLLLFSDQRSIVILSTTATYFRCNPEKLNNSYLKGMLQSSHFVRQYQAVMAQLTRFQVPITAQRKLSLVIPPLPEQRAIATALSDVDALLGALDRLIAKKRDLKQAAMQQLLTGQTRLPGFHGEWEVKTVGGTRLNIRRINWSDKRGRSAEGSGHYVTCTNVMTNVIIDCRALSALKFRDRVQNRDLAEGDLLFKANPRMPRISGMCAVLIDRCSTSVLKQLLLWFQFHDGD